MVQWRTSIIDHDFGSVRNVISWTDAAPEFSTSRRRFIASHRFRDCADISHFYQLLLQNSWQLFDKFSPSHMTESKLVNILAQNYNNYYESTSCFCNKLTADNEENKCVFYADVGKFDSRLLWRGSRLKSKWFKSVHVVLEPSKMNCPVHELLFSKLLRTIYPSQLDIKVFV